MTDKQIGSIEEQGRRLRAAFEQAESAAVAQRARPPRRRRWLVAIPAVVLLCAVLVLGIGLSRSRDGGVLTLDQAVAAVARAAFDAPGVIPGKTLYTKSRVTGTVYGYSRPVGSYKAEQTTDWESWYSGGDQGLERITIHPLAFPSDRDRARWKYNTGGSRGARRLQSRDTRRHVVVCRTSRSAQAAMPGDAATMLHLRAGTQIPTDPAAVYKLLRDRAAATFAGVDPVARGIWNMIQNSLRGGGPGLSPAQRAAVAGALAKLPGVRTLGRVDDPNGVQSIGFEREFLDGRIRSRVYFDASTGITSYFDDTSLKTVDPAHPTSHGVGMSLPPAGTTMLRYELLGYRHIDRAPALKVTRTPLASDYCPLPRHKRK